MENQNELLTEVKKIVRYQEYHRAHLGRIAWWVTFFGIIAIVSVFIALLSLLMSV